ncbi:DUF5131 family protein [Ralstonia pseudosolanacearum]|uniref:DUF5131 family protein n=1 Tax=Ralstonia pseudosolanacearum TaxID=1310165 RepID=UPI003CF92361
MAMVTGVSWTRSTFNPWIGCTKIGLGCDHCYAEAQDARFYQSAHWGPGAPRLLTKDRNWQQPVLWNRLAMESGEFWPVFCASQADVFDNEVPQEWRDRLWALIKATPALTWQLVTKRVGNVQKMLPADWGDGYPNVWLIATVVNQEEAERDIPKLKSIPAPVHGLSIEPMLGSIDLTVADRRHGNRLIDDIEWVIIGGESRQPGAPARDFDLSLAELLLDQCAQAGVPVFFKQMGHAPVRHRKKVAFTGKGVDLAEWPEHFRKQAFPQGRELALAA